MSNYNPQEIEKKWQKHWKDTQAYKVANSSTKPKYYVLDMFPYPSGAGLHVGHPLGYIASDIVARYKRHKGFNVLHPMGFDAFGLPAEQYAIQTGQHPAVTTAQNIARYKEQLDNIGFGYDWDREVQTCDPEYYKWTQWIFCQLFNSWYDKTADKARSINELTDIFSKEGNTTVNAHGDETPAFTAAEWNAKSEEEQQQTLLNYRLAYLANSMVNWCPELGTVLANEEVKDGLSERGGYPVFRVNMRQWFLRITAYADRLLNDLEGIDWTEALKEQQRNWIGRSEGASIVFDVQGHNDKIEVFSTRPDTIYGATFMVLAPEHELVPMITTEAQKAEVEKYIDYAGKRSERDRMSEVKTVTGCFTGAYATNPMTGLPIPIWIADYVLAGYGTGAVMAVPGHDSRDYAFAKQFVLPIVQVVTDKNNTVSIETESFDAKDGVLINSDILNGLSVTEAKKTIIAKLEAMGIGKGKVNYRLRDAGFSRQRYWGEPFPIVYRNGLPYLVDESELPVTLPEVESYKPTGDGNSPLAALEHWVNTPNGQRETNTMPGWAGSSWYFLRYMDNKNPNELAGQEAINYWQNVDLYLGGSEHATGHLLYVRFWTKFLYDIGKIPVTEPAKKLINQGMIQGTSAFVYRINGTNKFVSHNLKQDYETTAIHIDVNIVEGNVVDLEKLRAWRDEFKDSEFITKNGKYVVGNEVEKMSKRWHNVVNPDDVVSKYGADTLRLYEMFLGPLEQSKPWNTNGIEGVYRFLGKFWRLYNISEDGKAQLSEDAPTKEELKVLHKTIKKTAEDIEGFSFNTTVSAFMICANELSQLKCNKRQILEPLLVCISPYAPHIAEELWAACGNTNSILDVEFPAFNPECLVENVFSYPVSINGKTREQIEFPLDADEETIKAGVLANETVQKWMEGKPIKKFILVKGRIINVVV
ncbi:MAG: leucine--tRNA ligase [Bacteroidetes bacterium]|nr:MAG: leucine--tRNA ligase [Bacteroidota bacterium]